MKKQHSTRPPHLTSNGKKSEKLLFNKWLWLLVGTGVLIVLYSVNPTQSRFIPQCPFKSLTGWDCPGCGFQRAVHAFLHGHWVEAAQYNFFLLYALPYIGAIIVTEYLLKGERQAQWRNKVESAKALKFYVISYLLWGILRNLLHC